METEPGTFSCAACGELELDRFDFACPQCGGPLQVAAGRTGIVALRGRTHDFLKPPPLPNHVRQLRLRQHPTISTCIPAPARTTRTRIITTITNQHGHEHGHAP